MRACLGGRVTGQGQPVCNIPGTGGQGPFSECWPWDLNQQPSDHSPNVLNHTLPPEACLSLVSTCDYGFVLQYILLHVLVTKNKVTCTLCLFAPLTWFQSKRYMCCVNTAWITSDNMVPQPVSSVGSHLLAGVASLSLKGQQIQVTF